MKATSSIDRFGVTISFDAKPPDNVRSALKASGFRWNRAAGHWWRQRVEGAADFLGALERLLNPGKPDGACWSCGNPAGFFRPEGPATPVYCDDCYAARREAQRDARRSDPTDTRYEDQCREQCGL